MPYHHESLALAVDDANALIARVRRSMAECTSRALREAVVAVVRQSYQLQCAADGMIYQLALCEAASELGVEVHQCRRGKEIAREAAGLQVAVREMESFVSVNSDVTPLKYSKPCFPW